MTHTAGPATPGDLTRPEVVRREHGLRMFRDPLPVPRVLRPRDGRLTVTMRNAWVSLHSDLPRTRVWAYDGEFPGPTIEVRRGQRLRMEWRNRINGPHPVTAVEEPAAAATPEPGRDGAEPLPTVAAMPPWNVVHLHGGRTNAGNDGWMENGILPGEAQLSEYLNDQPATALWYHDHPMHVTAYSVFAGLAGMYLVRDDEEDELDLPCGDHEIPLVLCDRNLDTDADGNLTGQLLHKVAGDPGRMLPFMGPFMLVNGKIWPHLDVEPRWYRFRVLNASNARTYRLELRDEAGQPLPGALCAIGSDAGLLPAPVPMDSLELGSGERADILVDFGRHRGQRLALANTFVERFTLPVPAPSPDIMEFRVRGLLRPERFTLPDVVSRSFARIDHHAIGHHEHRWVVLTPGEIWEMRPVDAGTVTIPSDGIVQVVVGDKTHTLKRVARVHQDPVNFFVTLDAYESWNVLNLGFAGHPFHIHLVRFQAFVRDHYDTRVFAPPLGGTTAPLVRDEPRTLDPVELGWKDVVRVGPGEFVTLIGQFSGGTGRYMYHCHILEHEDHDMMRSFLVLPKQIPGPHQGGHSH